MADHATDRGGGEAADPDRSFGARGSQPFRPAAVPGPRPGQDHRGSALGGDRPCAGLRGPARGTHGAKLSQPAAYHLRYRGAVERGDLTGTILDGRYRVLEPVAEGAMGIVYRAERVKLGRIVAIKVLHDVLPHELSGRKRSEIEAMAMAKLEHP